MRSACFAALGLFLVSCLDFDNFQVESETSSSSAGGGGAGTGGEIGGGGSQAGGAPTGGGGSGTGAAGGGGAPGIGPCFTGDLVADDFDDGEALSWSVNNTAFVNDQAELRFTADQIAYMALLAKPGVLDECYFQVELVSAPLGTVYILFRGPDSGNQTFGLYLQNGVPSGQVLPTGTVPLEDMSNFTEGFVRIGEEGGTYFIRTAANADGPWTVRYETTTPPAWLSSAGHFILGAYGGPTNDLTIVDNFNTP